MSYFGNLINFKSHSLLLPSQYYKQIVNLVRHASKTSDTLNYPFARQIDFWSMAVSVALSKDLAPLPESELKDLRKFTETRSVPLPDEICELLAMATYNKFGADSEEARDPRQIIKLGNRLAAVGTQVIIGAINDPDLTKSAQEKVFDLALSLIQAQTEGEQP